MNFYGMIGIILALVTFYSLPTIGRFVNKKVLKDDPIKDIILESMLGLITIILIAAACFIGYKVGCLFSGFLK
jgi:hypothetical protein